MNNYLYSSRNNLTGINIYGNELNLMGKYSYNYTHTPSNNKLKKLKERILNNYLIPLVSKQWNILKENIFFIDEIQHKIKYHIDIYKQDEPDLIPYSEMLKVFKILIEKQKLLEDYDEKHNGKRESNEIMKMVFKTSMIRLLPEYEIYDSIFGKPKRELNEKYDHDIIEQIKVLLKDDDITYKKIKDYVTHNSNDKNS
jgi:hypothetical protein